MESNRLADGDSAGEQETGIRVNLDAADDKAVSRVKPRTPSRPNKSWAENSNDRSKDVKMRITRIEQRFNQQLADQQAAHQRQIAEMRKEFEGRLNKDDGAATGDEAAHQKVMDDLQQKLEDANERGDSKEASRITREMSKAEGQFWAAKTAKQTQGAASTGDRGGAAAGGDGGEGGTQRQSKHTKAGVSWAKANGEWWNDTVDDISIDARNYANSLHKRMLADGEDPEDPDYFERIGKQVKKRFPEIEVKSPGARRRADPDEDPDDADGDDDEGTNTRRGPSANLPNRGDGGRRNANVHTLTRADIATMRSVQLDPDNNKHVLQFLRSKQEDEANA